MIFDFSLQASLNSSLPSVFQAFTSPTRISQWCSPNNLTVFRFVGKIDEDEDFRLVMQGKDGFQQSLIGTCHEVINEQKITFSCRWEDTNDHTKVSIDFMSTHNQTTKLNISHTGFRTRNDMLQQQFAWIDCLEKLSINLNEYADIASAFSKKKISEDTRSNASPT